MGKQLGGETALSVIVTGETIGRSAGSDFHSNLRQGCCAEVASGDTAVGIEFVVVWGLPGHGGFLSIEI